MVSERMRLGVAGAIFLAGGGVLLNGYFKSRPRDMPAVVIDHPVTQEVLDVSDESRYTELKPDGRLETLQAVESSIIAQAQRILRVRSLGDGCARDLASAFSERVSAMYWPDFDRDFSASKKRGDPTPQSDAKTMFDQRAAFQATQEWGPRVAMDGVEVSLIEIGPDEELNINRERHDAGFGVSVGKRTMYLFPVPENPVKRGFVCVEVVMPMYQYEVTSESMKPVILGYHFVWDANKQRWVPYESVLFVSPDLIFGVPVL